MHAVTDLAGVDDLDVEIKMAAISKGLPVTWTLSKDL